MFIRKNFYKKIGQNINEQGYNFSHNYLMYIM